MERENISNLPSTLVKKKNIFEFFFKGIQKKNDFLEIDKIIQNLSTIKDFDTLSMPAFKHIVEKKIKENNDGTLFMSDINNLYEANKFRDKQEVNADLKHIINTMKEKITQKGIENFDIGKMGDEIYLHLPNCNEDITNELFNEFNSIEKNFLSLSTGFTKNLDNGLETAMKESDEIMYINKLEYKRKELKDFCGGSIDKLIQYTIKKELSKSRIDLNKLRDDSSRMSFVNTFDIVIKNNSIEDLLAKKDVAIQNPSDIKDKNSYTTLAKKFKTEARYKYNNLTKEEEEKYVLASILSKSNLEGCISHEYFECMEKSKLKNKKDFELLSLDISGLKFVNDEYGHDEGDKEIENVLSNLNNLLKQENINTYSDIVTKGAGNAFVIVPKLNENKKSELLNKMSNCQTKLGILCEISGKKDLPKEKQSLKGLDLFQELRNYNEKVLDVKSSNTKITDEKNVKRLIQNIYSSIFKDELLQMSMDENDYEKEVISNKINESFIKTLYCENPEDYSLSEQELKIPITYKSKHTDKDIDFQENMDKSNKKNNSNDEYII